MLMYTTHALNYVSLDALCRKVHEAPHRCPFCHLPMADCDCGFGQLSLDRKRSAGIVGGKGRE